MPLIQQKKVYNIIDMKTQEKIALQGVLETPDKIEDGKIKIKNNVFIFFQVEIKNNTNTLKSN